MRLRFGCTARTAIAALVTTILSVAATAAGPITEEILSFETHDGLTFAGYLTYPNRGTGPFPGVLLITGSGLQDADVTVRDAYGVRGVQKLYKGLAHDFSRQGFTVFRYNKRGGSFDHANDDLELLLAADHDDLLEDARNALRALVGHPKTAATGLTVVGHSEGTLLALRLGVGHREIDLLILIGSGARQFAKIGRYQSVDRSIHFAHEAGDADGDGYLTLEELERIGGDYGRGSFHVLMMQTILFELRQLPEGGTEVLGFSPQVDTDGDGRVDIDGELLPALEAAMSRNVERWRSGELGRYYQSFFENKAPLQYVHRVRGKILIAQGELDVVTHVSESLRLIEKLDRLNRPWEALLFPSLGHTLSKSRDYFAEDGGLTILDNPTQNAPTKRARARIIRKAKKMLELETQ